MKNIIWLITLLLFTNPSLSTAKSVNDKTENNKEGVDYRILFVGNSLTYTNNLPALVKNKASAEGITIETKMLAKPNYAIVDHWADGNVQNLIKSKQYDYVIIQQGPSSQANGYHMLVNGGQQYKELCEAYGAELVYFMVWPAKRHYFTFDGVIANYTAAAEANHALLAPVGKVWKAHFDTTHDYSYYGPDQFHPSLKGSQVAADVITETLFNTGPEVTSDIQQAWLVGIGNILENSIDVPEVYLTRGGVFGENFDPENINNIPWGNLKIEFTSCHQADMNYESSLSIDAFEFGSGGYPIQRLAMNRAARDCDDNNFNNIEDKSFFSGTFYGGDSRDGEGFNIDLLDDQKAIVTWFTYLPTPNR